MSDADLPGPAETGPGRRRQLLSLLTECFGTGGQSKAIWRPSKERPAASQTRIQRPPLRDFTIGILVKVSTTIQVQDSSMRRLPGPAETGRGDEGRSDFRGSLLVVSGLAENPHSIFCEESKDSKAANGCPVLRDAWTIAERHTWRNRAC